MSSRRQHGEASDSSCTTKLFMSKAKSTSIAAIGDPPPQSIRVPSSSSSSSSCSSSNSSSSRVQLYLGEKGIRVFHRFRDGNFVNYLPQDEAVAIGLGAKDGGLDPLESQGVLDLLNKELSRLLTLKPRDFWKEVWIDTTLHGFVESFLKYRSRWYDLPSHGAKGEIAGILVGEADLVRRVFMLLYRVSSRGSLNAEEHTALLKETKLLELPKLLDVCAIYGRENPELTRQLVGNALDSQPGTGVGLPSLVTRFIDITGTMNDSHSETMIDFVNDAVVSMDAFLRACPHAGFLFCSSYGSSGEAGLLTALARWHDAAIPSVRPGPVAGGSTNPDAVTSRLLSFCWNLLEASYLSVDAVPDASLPPPSRMFPSGVADPNVRGDIVIHALLEVSGASPGFLPKLARSHGLNAKLRRLQQTGWICMDEAQLRRVSEITEQSLCGGGGDSVDDMARRIQDVFPDHERSFILSCLDACGRDPDEAIRRILDGTVHSPEPPPRPADAKGKAKVSELDGPSAAGRYTRKSRAGGADFQDLADVDTVKTTALLAARQEYEDEYDDSFDDLGVGPVEPSDEVPVSTGESGGKLQFFVKDGKNYGYKVAGSVAVADARQASLVHRTQRGLIHGLGRGGNALLNGRDTDSVGEVPDVRGAGRGARGRGRGRSHHQKDRALRKHMSSVSGY